MSLNLKAAAAVTLVALLAAPALAATATPLAATMMKAEKADAMPIAQLTGMIGMWTANDLSMLDKAKSIKVLDTKTLYNEADLKQIASVEGTKKADIDKIRAALKGDAALDAWLTTNKVDLNRVVAVSAPATGTPEIVLY
jgi:hypothetical protein